MTSDQWTFAGVLITALAAFAIAVRQSRSSEKVGTQGVTAAEVEALGGRLDAQADQLAKQSDRIDDLERRNRALYSYIALDHAQHHANGWPVIPLPGEIA